MIYFFLIRKEKNHFIDILTLLIDIRSPNFRSNHSAHFRIDVIFVVCFKSLNSVDEMKKKGICLLEHFSSNKISQFSINQ